MSTELGSFLAILQTAGRVADWFTGLKAGRDHKRILQELDRLHAEVQRISDRVLYAPQFHQVTDLSAASPKTLIDLPALERIAAPLDACFDDDVLMTSVVRTPNKLQRAFGEDPWGVLFEIRPLAHAVRPTNPGCVPVLFTEGELPYVGWQMKGVLPSLLECEYSDELEPSPRLIEHPLPDTLTPPGPSGKGPVRLSPSDLTRELTKLLPQDDLHISADIPAKKLRNARDKCRVPNEEEIVALIDLTVFGSAKNVLLFGCSGIYYHNGWTGQAGPGWVSYEDFPKREFQRGPFLEVGLGGNQLLDCSGGSSSLVVKALRSVQRLVADQMMHRARESAACLSVVRGVTTR